MLRLTFSKPPVRHEAALYLLHRSWLVLQENGELLVDVYQQIAGEQLLIFLSDIAADELHMLAIPFMDFRFENKTTTSPARQGSISPRPRRSHR